MVGQVKKQLGLRLRQCQLGRRSTQAEVAMKAVHAGLRHNQTLIEFIRRTDDADGDSALGYTDSGDGNPIHWTRLLGCARSNGLR